MTAFLTTPCHGARLFFISSLLFSLSCGEPFAPAEVEILEGLATLYQLEADRRFETLIQYCAPCEFHAHKERTACQEMFADTKKWGRPTLVSCRVKVFGRYTDSGKVLRAYCDVIRRNRMGRETLWVDAIYPSKMDKCSLTFKVVRMRRYESSD